MLNDLRGKSVLITGGTRGIGLATGLAFGREGAVCTLTHRWGSADEDDIRRQFKEAGAPEPFIVEADVSNDDDTKALLGALKDRCKRIEAFVSSVSFAQVGNKIEDFKRGALLRSMEYTVWPTIGYLQQMKKTFGAYPRYVIGFSSTGPEQHEPNYDFVAACKAALESLFRYLAYRLIDEDSRFNIIRATYVLTESLDATLGPDFRDFIDEKNPALVVPAEEVANATLALCSGLMDGVTGQVLMIDHGANFANNLMGLFEKYQQQTNLGKEAK